MRAGLSFSYSPISLLLRQPLSIKKSYAGAIQVQCQRLSVGMKETSEGFAQATTTFYFVYDIVRKNFHLRNIMP
jgi:hypothetical protein